MQELQVRSQRLPGVPRSRSARKGSCRNHCLAEISSVNRIAPSKQRRRDGSSERQSGVPRREAGEQRFRDALAAAMDKANVSAIVYPTWDNVPRLIGDLNTPAGDNSQVLSPASGFPAINVPVGFARGEFPAGMTILGRAWSESTLFKLAYSYEQTTKHRRPPASAPPLR